MTDTLDREDQLEFLLAEEQVRRASAELALAHASAARVKDRIIAKYQLGPLDEVDIAKGTIKRTSIERKLATLHEAPDGGTLPRSYGSDDEVA